MASKYTNEQYDQLVKEHSPDSPIISNCLKAFVVGGMISILGQFIHNTLTNMSVSTEHVPAYTAIILVFIGVALTTFNLYSRIGRFSGAGSIVPITGFANAVASAAVEFKKEGFILGLGAKLFTIAGPVIAYGVATSMVVGLVYYFIKYIGG